MKLDLSDTLFGVPGMAVVCCVHPHVSAGHPHIAPWLLQPTLSYQQCLEVLNIHSPKCYSCEF